MTASYSLLYATINLLFDHIDVRTSIAKLKKEFHHSAFLSSHFANRNLMLPLFKRDHFILGHAANGILYIKNEKNISFDDLKRLGYDSTRPIDRHNNLFEQALKIKVSHFMPLRENLWLSPLLTVVSASPLSPEEVFHWYRFCELLGGINITISYVSSVQAFLDKPSLKLVRQNYSIAC